MRTEYTFAVKHPDGKTDFCTYARNYVMENYKKAKSFYEPKGCEVKLYRVRYIGNLFHDKIEIENI